MMQDIATQMISKEAVAVADSAAVHKAAFVAKFESLSHMSVEELVRTIAQHTLIVIGKLLIATAIYFLGRWLIRYVLRVQRRIMERRDVDVSLRLFLSNLNKIVMVVILIAMIIGILGIDTTSFVAIFASAGLAVGMALSGTLQNFAGGLMILAIKPFRIGDFIETLSQSGKVKEIRLFHTVLTTADNKTILVPNGSLSSNIINNYSHEGIRRLEWVFGIGYGEDYDRAKALITCLLDADKRILTERDRLIAVQSLGSSSVNIVVRAWVNIDDLWPVYFSLNEAVYKTFGSEGINIPFPQMDVHLKAASAEEKP